MNDNEKEVLRQLVDASYDDDTVALARINCVLSTTYDSVMSHVLLDLLRKMEEYTHALTHVAEDSEWHSPSACADCQRLARSVLERT